MPTYKIEIDPGLPGVTLYNGHNAMLIEAEDATDARSIVDAITAEHAAVGAWSNATLVEVTEADLSPIVDPATGDEIAYSLTVTIAGGSTNATFTETAVAGKSFVQVMADMVTALNAHADIANAAWSTPDLTVAGIADGIGDHTLTVSFKLGDQEIESVVGSITHEGIAGAVLEVAMTTGVRAPSIQFYKS